MGVLRTKEMPTANTPVCFEDAWKEEDSIYDDEVVQLPLPTYGTGPLSPSSPFPHSPPEAFSTPGDQINYTAYIVELCGCDSSPLKYESEKPKIAQGNKTPPADPRHLKPRDLTRESVY